jgi:hypothetical protein
MSGLLFGLCRCLFEAKKGRSPLIQARPLYMEGKEIKNGC